MKRKLTLCNLFLSVLILLVSCRWPALEQEQQIDQGQKNYYIDSSSLLQSLAQSEKDSFILQTATPKATLPTSPSSISWKQADYYFIAQSFYQLVLGESLSEWKLTKMYFGLDCKDINTGLQQAGFTFFKTEHTRDRDSRLIRYINIAPKENQVYFSETEYYPELEQWQFIDLNQIKISAEGALEIAEKAGGSKIRTDKGNNCYVTELFDSRGKFNGWSLWYSSDNGSVFVIDISPLTGEYKIIR
jgi:hypothetical protein